jgi:hypothetical protein
MTLPSRRDTLTTRAITAFVDEARHPTLDRPHMRRDWAAVFAS